MILEARREILVADRNVRIEYPEYSQTFLYQDLLSVALSAKVKGVEINAIKILLSFMKPPKWRRNVCFTFYFIFTKMIMNGNVVFQAFQSLNWSLMP